MIEQLKKNYFLFFFNIINIALSFLLRYKKNEVYKSKRLLIVFVNAIGDFVIFTSILEGISKHFKDYDITLLGFDRWQDLVRNISFISYIPFNRSLLYRNPFYLFKILFLLKKNSFVIAIYPSYSRMLLGDLLMKACKSQEKIAFDGDTNNITERTKARNNNEIYSKLVAKPTNIVREINYYHHFALQLNIKNYDIGVPMIWFSKNDQTNSESILKAHGIEENDRYIVIAPGAASYKRVWNTENYVEVCKYLHNYHFKVLITGSNSQKYLAEEIQNLIEFNVIDLTGKTNLLELAAIYKKANLYLGSESGLLHIATAVGIPTICILGGGHPFRFYPYGDLDLHKVVFKKMSCYGCNWQCIYDEVKCIKEIEPKQVIEEVDILLNNKVLKQNNGKAYINDSY